MQETDRFGIDGVVSTSTAFESFVSHGMDAAHPALHDWFTVDALRENFVAALQPDVRAMSDAALAERLAAEHPIAGASHRDYLPRVLEIEAGQRVIAQVCFQADSLSFPHVLVKHRDFPLDSPDRIEILRAKIIEAFSDFEIERIWVYMHAPFNGDAEPESERLGMTLYKRYLAAPIAQMIEMDAPHADRIRIEPAFKVDFYDAYSQTYDTVWEQAPALRDLVRKETPEDFDRYARADGLRKVYIDDQLAGIVAAHPEIEHGLRGWCMHERLIFTPFRGKGFGSAVLGLFIKSLHSAADDVVYGTIVPPNQPSMRSALKMGRIDVGSSYWIDAT